MMGIDEQMQKTQEKTTETINTAVAALDGYGSDRVKLEHERMDTENASSHIIGLPNRDLTFFGSFHTTNPESPTVKELRDDLRETLSKVYPEEISFMIEGRYGKCDRESVLEEMKNIETVEEAVEKDGEGGIAMWLVAEYAKRGIEIEISSPERPELEIGAEMRKEFASEDIATYLMLRQWTTELGGHRTGEYSVVDFARRSSSTSCRRTNDAGYKSAFSFAGL